LSKNKIGHKDVFVAHATNADYRPEKYRFDFNHKLVANNNDTNRIAGRKIKAYPMNLTTEIGSLLLMALTIINKRQNFIMH
jgi:hypothetical protein